MARKNTIKSQYRKARERFRERVNYYKKIGYEFDESKLPPLVSKPTRASINRLEKLKGEKLTNLSTRFVTSHGKLLYEKEEIKEYRNYTNVKDIRDYKKFVYSIINEEKPNLNLKNSSYADIYREFQDTMYEIQERNERRRQEERNDFVDITWNEYDDAYDDDYNEDEYTDEPERYKPEKEDIFNNQSPNEVFDESTTNESGEEYYFKVMNLISDYEEVDSELSQKASDYFYSLAKNFPEERIGYAFSVQPEDVIKELQTAWYYESHNQSSKAKKAVDNFCALCVRIGTALGGNDYFDYLHSEELV